MHIRVIHNALISGMYPTQSKTRVETMRVTAVDVSITAGAKPSLRKITAVGCVDYCRSKICGLPNIHHCHDGEAFAI
jgi:hypothetical protein